MTMPLIAAAGIAPGIFSDKYEYLNAVNSGLSGNIVKMTINTIPEQRQLICRALGTSSNNLSRLYRRKLLSRQQSEEMLDILAVYSSAYELYDNLDTAMMLLNTHIPALNNQKPVDLLDTFIGRSMVKEVLNKMKWGEFT